MRVLARLFLALLFLKMCGFASAQVARDVAVEVSATVQETSPQITLSWTASTYPVALQKVYRRLKGAPQWTEIATPANGELSYIDTGVAAGISYEYFVLRLLNIGGNGVPAYGYLSAGIRVPLAENRGRVILLVDDTMSAALATELDRFTADLIGDGWTVARQDVSPTAAVTAVKATIQALHAVDPANTKSLILFGRIPVPYSGDLNPDGHPEHRGAWPADVYYGDIDGVWTDSYINDSNAAWPENRNVPGDGKFDQTVLPSSVELEVGRIDFFGMANVSQNLTETGLLKQYLDRDHAYRYKTGAFANIGRRGLIDDNFGFFNGEAFASTGWRNFSSFFGSGSGTIVETDWFTTLGTESYLWAYGCGPGSPVACAGIGESGSFAANKSLAVFNILFGSYFGDWDKSNNFLRAPIAGHPDSLGLVSVWAGRPHWHFYSMATGATVGYATRITQNNTGIFNEGYVTNAAGRQVHIALMGDPTLRLHQVVPVTNLSADATSGVPALTWTTPAESNVEGYRIDRASNPAGPFHRLTNALTIGTSFIDRTGAPGHSYTYMVRTVKQETSAGGTYLNSSQGVTVGGVFGAASALEINLTGNGEVVTNGDTLASTANGTDFGSAEVNLQSATHTFTITNDGTAPLIFPENAATISGSGASQYSVTTQPPASIPPGGSGSFVIRFAPTNVGGNPATVTLTDNDPDEGSYQFAIQGSGLPATPEIELSPGSFSQTLAPGASSNVPLTIGNSGPVQLNYSLSSSLAKYSFQDSNAAAGPQFAWIDISATGSEITAFTNPDDGISAAINLGFVFPFFGNNFTALRVCTNGFISFTDGSVPYDNTAFPYLGAPRNMITAFWDDMIMDANTHIYTQQIGSLFVVQFNDLLVFSSSERVTCEIVLKQQNGEILLQYKDFTVVTPSYTIGIQNHTRDEGLLVTFNSAYLTPNFAIHIFPKQFYSWLGVSVAPGSVSPGSSLVENLGFNTSGLSGGYYEAVLSVASNDADESLLQVPIHLIVTGPEIEVLGNGLIIADDDVTPSAVDRTDFGTIRTDAAPVSRTFTIRNTGSSPLSISDVNVSGSGFSISSAPASTLGSLGSTALTVSFDPSVSGAVLGMVSFTTNDSDESAYHFAVRGTGITPGESWRQANFNTTANAGDAADLADPDFDGIANVAEYGFTLDPRAPGTAGLPVASEGSGGYLTIQFTRNTTRTDLIYEVEASSDLVTWDPIASSVAGGAITAGSAHSATETTSGTVRTVTVEDSLPISANGTRFLRVKITRIE